jgi:PTH1 family peptidyl-tRNA hydrolase
LIIENISIFSYRIFRILFDENQISLDFMGIKGKLKSADDSDIRGVTVVKIICGLGNPGSRYEHTRHNLGFDVIDRLAERLDITGEGQAPQFDYRIASAAGGVYLIKPATYVNRSGLAVSEALRMFRTDPAEFFVINDDFHLSLGTVRIRKEGSSGGHNGLESIIEEIDRTDFARMRLGIGPLPEWAVEDGEKVPDFVLGRFEPDEVEIVEKMKSHAVEALETILNESLDLAISKYNKVNPTPEE